MSDKGLVAKCVFLQLNNKTITDEQKNCKEDILPDMMDDKHMKRYSSSFVIREIQI